MEKLSFVEKFLFLINSFVALALLISYLAPITDPEFFWPVAFFGLAYPVLLSINILFAFYWLIRIKIQFLLSLIVVVTGWGQVSNILQFGNNKAETEGNFIKVMSYNVRLFDLYNWSNNKTTRNKIFDLIKSESADILCFQEFFYSTEKSYFKTLDTLKQFQKAKFPHVEVTKSIINGTHNFGIATFSKYPIIYKGIVDLKDTNNNICIFTDLLINKDTIRVYNMHLASIRFQNQDYQFIDNITEKQPEEQLQGSKKIISRLKNAFTRRSKQAKTIADHIRQSPYQVIVCGDFNDSPCSFAYRTICSGLNDGFKESGTGMGVTYNGKFPAFRIDYILHGQQLVSDNFETLPDELSDHYPITCEIAVKK